MNRDLLHQYLSFYQDLGIRTLYRRGSPIAAPQTASEATASPETPIEPEAPAVKKTAAAHKTQAVPEAVIPPAPAEDAAQLFEKPATDRSLAEISKEIGDCTRCRLHEKRHKIVFGAGNEQTKLVFVGEGPGADEDAQGVPFVGRAGQLLTQMIEGTAHKEGIPLSRKDVYICNVVKCRPPENRTPLPDEMEICGQFLCRQLVVIRPKAICVLGATAAKALLNRREGVTRLRGNWFRWRDIPVMVTYHPSYLLRPYNQNAKREAWEDLKKVLHYVYD